MWLKSSDDLGAKKLSRARSSAAELADGAQLSRHRSPLSSDHRTGGRGLLHRRRRLRDQTSAPSPTAMPSHSVGIGSRNPVAAAETTTPAPKAAAMTTPVWRGTPPITSPSGSARMGHRLAESIAER